MDFNWLKEKRSILCDKVDGFLNENNTFQFSRQFVSRMEKKLDSF